ncbi:hypothetical protein KIN20_015409 [Parelaphostrongylus tenuis]|uniref:Uncharacterized protein n=1 Tax=Parelaphostrongylus tenuis TaxID=148309 RepID=A0AAD5N0A2_PARTN|nr:hypothetical protein KIN20_015409 [Parelaphostrongylus tenuis]
MDDNRDKKIGWEMCWIRTIREDGLSNYPTAHEQNRRLNKKDYVKLQQMQDASDGTKKKIVMKNWRSNFLSEKNAQQGNPNKTKDNPDELQRVDVSPRPAYSSHAALSACGPVPFNGTFRA